MHSKFTRFTSVKLHGSKYPKHRRRYAWETADLLPQIYSPHHLARSILLDRVPELAEKRLESIYLLDDEIRSVIDVLLSLKRNRIEWRNSKIDSFAQMAAYAERLDETAEWELRSLPPLTVRMENASRTDTNRLDRNREKSVSMLFANDGIVGICNRRLGYCLWYVVQCLRTPGEGDDIIRHLFYDGGTPEILHRFVTFVHKIHDRQGAAPEPNRSIKIVNADSSFKLEPILPGQRIYMTPEVKANAWDDFHFFLENEDWYELNNLQYKRGYLFVGPPGNGKTTMIRSMAATPGFNAYIFDFRDAHNSGNADLLEAFNTAAENAPSLFIMEDIDRIFERGEDRCRITRDALLNCLDGLMCRKGVVVVATANHPHLIDEALLKRPGRFDRLVTFAGPDREMRRRMLADSFAANQENDVDADTIELLADKTAGFSMASVKELFIASASVAFQKRRLAIHSADAVTALTQLVGQYSTNGVSRPVGFGK